MGLTYDIFIKVAAEILTFLLSFKQESGTMETETNKIEYGNNCHKGPIWMDKILPHEEYFDAHLLPFGIYREGPFCHLQNRDIEIAGNKYNSCEQFVQAKKAMMFGDIKTLNKIMEETNPKIMKQRAKEIKNVQEDVWNDSMFDILTQANYHKFTQNADLKVLLLSTGRKLLVQCNDVAKPPRSGCTRSKSETRRNGGKILAHLNSNLLTGKNDTEHKNFVQDNPFKGSKNFASESASEKQTSNTSLPNKNAVDYLTPNSHGLLPERKTSKTNSSTDSYLDKAREGDAQDVRKWDKKNMIGQSLMVVRKRLVNEELERKNRLLGAMNLYQELDKK